LGEGVRHWFKKTGKFKLETAQGTTKRVAKALGREGRMSPNVRVAIGSGDKEGKAGLDEGGNKGKRKKRGRL